MKLWILLLVVLLAACGGGSPEDYAEMETQEARMRVPSCKSPSCSSL